MPNQESLIAEVLGGIATAQNALIKLSEATENDQAKRLILKRSAKLGRKTRKTVDLIFKP